MVVCEHVHNPGMAVTEGSNIATSQRLAIMYRQKLFDDSLPPPQFAVWAALKFAGVGDKPQTCFKFRFRPPKGIHMQLPHHLSTCCVQVNSYFTFVLPIDHATISLLPLLPQ